MPKKKSDPRSGWEQAAALCGHARSDRASLETKRRAQEVLTCLGSVERRAFLGVVVKQLPDIGQQLGVFTTVRNHFDTWTSWYFYFGAGSKLK